MNQVRKSNSDEQEVGRRDLYRKNKLLQEKLDELVESLNRYRITQTRFESFELSLLECEGFYEIIECLTQTLQKQFKLDAVTLTLFDPDSIAKELLQGKHLDFNNLELTESHQDLCAPIRDLQAKRLFPGGAIGHLRPQLSTDEEVIRFANFRSQSINSIAVLPLHREHLLIGYICLGSYSKERFGPGLAIDLLSHLAAVIAVCLENTLSREQLRQLSQIDMLTRVKNRRAFDKTLRTEIARSQRQSKPLSCLFADLDFFKNVNDTFGHATGDRVLKTVAKGIQEMLRETDTLARIGGEEFTVLLPDTDAEGGRDIAERIRMKIEELEIPDDSGKIVKLTTSIGYALWTPGVIANETTEDVHRRLMGTADKAVYKAKKSGRNRVRGEPYGKLSDVSSY